MGLDQIWSSRCFTGATPLIIDPHWHPWVSHSVEIEFSSRHYLLRSTRDPSSKMRQNTCGLVCDIARLFVRIVLVCESQVLVGCSDICSMMTKRCQSVILLAYQCQFARLPRTLSHRLELWDLLGTHETSSFTTGCASSGVIFILSPSIIGPLTATNALPRASLLRLKPSSGDSGCPILDIFLAATAARRIDGNMFPRFHV
ncbi:Uncharacterized protein HZ326_4699 [Fusarium oxysporum f. sp. albedinis]|nr:Uncharacterized protein HZ326_4699 [Fusarium oxysporum f. sp. albedinis]